MPQVFVNTIVFVSDINLSKKFYAEILGIKITNDLGTIVFFENSFVLHCAKSILSTVFKRQSVDEISKAQGGNNVLIYFECENQDELESTFNDVKGHISLIHDIEIQEWGQKVFRFYDPDGHIVEFGERMVEGKSP